MLAPHGIEQVEEDMHVLSVSKCRQAHILTKYLDEDDEDDEYLDMVLNELENELLVFTTLDQEGDLHIGLKKIFKLALELQVIFMESRAFFVPSLVPRGTIELDEETMDIQRHGKDQGKYQLIPVSPMIQKIGSSSGWDFHRRVFMFKARVVVHYLDEKSNHR
ncbi:hypothetical protein BGZ63DRAFT_374897 [Mariannaea sp. PMI_226]|nr:hypothetical protein BGZ63DRAFT_374897 [Mariannaea sp. PMI_226]